MVRVEDVFSFLNEIAPVERKMDFDNVGLLVGDREREVSKILVSLDITKSVAEEAAELNAELIVSHHPVIFHPLKNLLCDDETGSTIITLVKNDISAICMHTNLDVSVGGVNDALADKIGLEKTAVMVSDGEDEDGNEYGLGRYGELAEETGLSEFLMNVKKKLNANGLRYVDGGKKARKIAVCGGAGGDELDAAVSLGCDTYVTSDVKYNTFLDAKAMGINLIDAGHFPTENVVVEPVAKMLSERFEGVSVIISQKHEQPEKFI